MLLLSFGSVQASNFEPEYRESVQSWCQDQMRVLRRAHNEAQRHMNFGQFDFAAQSLLIGLQETVQNTDSYYTGTFTYKAALRGLELAAGIRAQGTDSRMAKRTLNYFLFEYYEFISFVSRKLDSDYAQRRDCHFCGLFGNREFEKNYVKFAKWQLKMVLDKLSTSDRIGRFYPIGTPKAFMSVFAKTSEFVALDLEDSVFATQFACTIDELNYVGNRVAAHVEEGTIFPNDYEAMQFAGSNGTNILNSFKCTTGSLPGRGSDRGQGQTATTFDALSGSRILHSGTTDSIYLPETTDIKKLIISAEGVRNDAMFDVVVNGEVKGTIYVPGRDPSYHVTIEDTASQIELVSRFGKARISRVLVIAHPQF